MSFPIPFCLSSLQPVGQQHGKDEQQADDASLGIAGDVDQREAIADVEDDEDGKHDTRERARPAKNTDATEQNHRDNV